MTDSPTCLVLNCIIGARARDGFDEDTVPRLAALAGRPVRIAHLGGGEALPGPGEYSHLLLTGSELSAAKGSDWDGPLMETIRASVDAGRVVLGICYGHQMIARALAGDGACRRADTPEFGWRRVEIAENPLFAGLGDPVFAHSHYDEVANLPDGFTVIAGTPDCAVQAFQVTGRPVWGVQFHPEVAREQAEAMFASNLQADPTIAPHLHDELQDPGVLIQCDRLFTNFFSETP